MENIKSKVFPIILIGLIIIFLVLAAGGFFLYQKEHAKNVQLSAQIDDLNARLKVTEGRLDESKKVAVDLQLKLQDAKTNIDNLAGDLEKEKTSHQDDLSKLEQLKTDLAQQKEKRLDMENKFAQVQDEAKKIKAQLSDLQTQKANLESKIKELESAANSKVELGRVIISSGAASNVAAETSSEAASEKKNKAKDDKAVKTDTKKPAAAESKKKLLEGKIIVVNKEFGFVVFNLGIKDGVKAADIYSVYRGDKYLGDIKVEKAHDSVSAAGFGDDLKDRINENDRVVQKVK